MSVRYAVTARPRAQAQPPRVKPLQVAIPNWFIALLVGAFIIGPFIWTPVGRFITTAAIAKGAKVSQKKVETWLAAG